MMAARARAARGRGSELAAPGWLARRTRRQPRDYLRHRGRAGYSLIAAGADALAAIRARTSSLATRMDRCGIPAGGSATGALVARGPARAHPLRARLLDRDGGRARRAAGRMPRGA